MTDLEFIQMRREEGRDEHQSGVRPPSILERALAWLHLSRPVH